MPTCQPVTQYKINIAGVIIHFIADSNLKLIHSETHHPFIVTEGEPDFRLQIHYGPLPTLKLEEKLLDSGGVWVLYRSNGKYEITFSSDILGPSPYQVAVIDSEFQSGDLYIEPREDHGTDYYINPTEYPLDEFLILNLLTRGRGIELHSCGVNYKGHGMIFAGDPGAGKSTLGQLWQEDKDANALSDERMVVRKLDNQFWIYGTPWLSEARIASPEGAPLESIFFIKHSQENTSVRLNAIDTASKLFTLGSLTFWDEKCLNFTLDFIGQLAEKIPCYELGFVPDNSVLVFLKDMMSRESSR